MTDSKTSPGSTVLPGEDADGVRDRSTLSPALQKICARLDPLGWSPDAPSSECRAALTPPGRVTRHQGFDRVGLVWRYAFLKVFFKINNGNVRDLTQDDVDRAGRVAYMHLCSWLGQLFKIHASDRTDHVAVYAELWRWEHERCQPGVQAVVAVLEEAEELAEQPEHEPGFSALLLECASGFIPVGLHRRSMAEGLVLHRLMSDESRKERPKRLPKTKKYEAMLDDEALDEMGTRGWFETLGQAGALAHIKDGRVLIEPADVRDQLNALFGSKGARSQRTFVSLLDDHSAEDTGDRKVLDTVLETIELDEFADLEEIERTFAMQPGRPDAARRAAEMRRLLGGSRRKYEKVFGVTTEAIRNAERHLTD